ncbi:MAG: response regulator transcription factor [Longimicrobiales bacterium]|nr:response regulator transcription factor [Longimicrobiales bacterium]
MSRILVVEDNEDLAFGLRTVLEFEGYEVEVATEGEAGLDSARKIPPDLLILDIMLPGKSGFEVLRELRTSGLRFPVLILTARSLESDVVLGFDFGADDYVTKPFSTAELLARVRSLLRRVLTGAGGPGGREPGGYDLMTFGEVEVSPATRTVRRGGELVELTPKEFDLLVALLGRRGAVISRQELLKEVWGYGNAAVNTRTVDVHLSELRRKLENDPANPRFILTVRKAGYRLDP